MLRSNDEAGRRSRKVGSSSESDAMAQDSVPRSATAVFVIASRIAATVLIVVSIALTYLSARAGQSEICVGRAWIDGYRNDPARVLPTALPLLLSFAAIMLFSLAAPKYLLATGDRVAINRSRLKTAVGILIVYGVLISAVEGLADLAWHSWARYAAIANYCHGGKRRIDEGRKPTDGVRWGG